MKLSEFFELIKKEEYRTDYIVQLKYKYAWEKEYTIDNVYLEYEANNDCWAWLYDWNEGQEEVEVLRYVSLENVFEPK